MYYLSINGEIEDHDNEMSYYLKIEKLRDAGFNIEYEKNNETYCYATKN